MWFFVSEKSTLDHLVRLETFIRDAFLNKQEVVSIFFDLEKHMIQHGNTVY